MGVLKRTIRVINQQFFIFYPIITPILRLNSSFWTLINTTFRLRLLLLRRWALKLSTDSKIITLPLILTFTSNVTSCKALIKASSIYSQVSQLHRERWLSDSEEHYTINNGWIELYNPNLPGFISFITRGCGSVCTRSIVHEQEMCSKACVRG